MLLASAFLEELPMVRFIVSLLGSSVLSVLLLTGCPAEPPPGPESCEVQRGYLSVCATYFGDVAEGSVLILGWGAGDYDLPIESLFGADGCTVVELPSGSYEWSAQHLTDSCVTPYVEVTIGQCEEVTEISMDLGDWCVDGR
jgi:hypothetical protein